MVAYSHAAPAQRFIKGKGCDAELQCKSHGDKCLLTLFVLVRAGSRLE